MTQSRFFNITNLATAFTHLNKTDFYNLALTSKQVKTFFHKPMQAAKLLHLVKESRWEAAGKMAKAEPELMFQEVELAQRKNVNGEQITLTEIISSLKYAFKIADTYAWNIFFLVCKDRDDLKKKFLEQALESLNTVDLHPLLNSYQDFFKQAALWKDEKINGTEFDNALLQVGVKQHEYLPWHFLKTLCYLKSNWYPDFNFKVAKTNLENYCAITILEQGKSINKSLTSSFEFQDFTILRGHSKKYSEVVGYTAKGQNYEANRLRAEAIDRAQDDYLTLIKLLATKKQELKEKIDELKSLFQENNSSLNNRN